MATFIMVFGMEGRGSWSKNIASVGGILWLLTVIYAFYIFPWQKGFYFLIGTLIVGAILQKILRPIINPRGR